MSKNRIRPFWGELFAQPVALEASFADCSYDCRYCFAALNDRDQDSEEINAAGTVKWITRVFSDAYNPLNFDEYILRNRHPVAISNAVDPCSPRNATTTRQVLEALRKFNVPVELLTRGPAKGKDWKSFIDLLPKRSVLYMSITTFDPEWGKKVEAGCPTNEQRLEMMAQAKQWRPDIRCIAAFNPTIPEAMGDPYEYTDKVFSLVGPGVIEGVWAEPLHLTRSQMTFVEERPLVEFAQGAFDRSLSEDARIDPGYWAALADALHSREDLRVYSGMGPSMIRGDIMELWPNPFAMTTGIGHECEALANETGAQTVVLTWKAWSSWAKQDLPEIPLKRGDMWATLNYRQSAGRENRHGLKDQEFYTILDLLHMHWDRPELGFNGVWNGGVWPVIMTDEQGRKAFAAEDDEVLAAWDRRFLDNGWVPDEAIDPDQAVFLPTFEETMLMLEAGEDEPPEAEAAS